MDLSFQQRCKELTQYGTSTKTETERPGVDESLPVWEVGIVNQWGNASVNSNWISTHKSQIQKRYAYHD